MARKDKGEEKDDISFSLSRFIGDLVGVDANTLLSIGEPELMRAGKKLAEFVDANVPKDHWIRKDLSQRLYGIFKARIEDAARGQPSVIQALIEKAADILDFAGYELYLHGKNESDSPQESPAPQAHRQTKMSDAVRKVAGSIDTQAAKAAPYVEKGVHWLAAIRSRVESKNKAKGDAL